MTRVELQEEAGRLAGVLGRTVDIGVSRAKLEALVEELKAEVAAKAGTTVPGSLETMDGTPGPAEQIPTTDLVSGEPLEPVIEAAAGTVEEPPAKAPPLVDGAAPVLGGPPANPATKAPRVPYYVAPRKSTIVAGRVVGPLTPVKASDFERGQADLDYLVSRGVVVKTGL